MKTVVVTTSGHETACEAINDDNVFVLNDVVNLVLHNAVCLDGNVNVVIDASIFGIGEVCNAEELLGLLNTVLGKNCGTSLLVNDEVLLVYVKILLGVHLLDYVAGHCSDKFVCHLVKVGGLGALTRDDKGSSRLVDKDGVHLVNDCEVMSTLYHSLLVNNHVVTEVVEAKLVVGTVCDVGSVCLTLFVTLLTVNDKTCGKAKEAVYTAHLVRVTLCKVVVNRYDMHALAAECVKVCGQGSNECLTFTCLHLCDTTLVEKNTTDELYLEGTLAENSLVCLTYKGKCLGKNIVKCLAACKVTLKLICICLKLGIAHRLELGGESLDCLNHRHNSLYLFFAISFE